MLHSGMMSRDDMRAQIDYFSHHYQVIALDSREQGRSSASEMQISYELMSKDLIELLDHLVIKKTNVFGIELETRLNLIENEDEKIILNFNTNLTKMWFNQDLSEEFHYKNNTESDLQGASDLIFNVSLGYNSQTEKEFIATLTGNYASDKIYALGSPEDFANSDVLFNDEIIEKGFFTIDLVVSKKLSDKLLLRLVGRNLLNPTIKQTQLIRDINTTTTTNEVVSSYKKGSQFNLSLKYSF